MDNSDLRALLRPVKSRLRQGAALRLGCISLSAGLLAASLWMALARFIPLWHYRWWMLLILSIPLLVGAFLLLLRRPDDQAAANWLDRNGLEDRVSTALNSADQSTVFAVLQREDAALRTRRFVNEHLRQRLSIRVDRKLWIATSLLAFVLAVLFILPNGMDELLAEGQKQRIWIDEQHERVQKLAEELEKKSPDLPERQEMLKTLNELQNELSREKLASEALKEMEQALVKLEAGKAGLEKKQLQSKQWADSWQRTDALRKLGESLAAGTSEDIRKAAGELGEQVARMTPQQKERLAAELERLAASASAPTDEAERQLREQLRQAAESLRSGQGTDAALAGLGAALASANAGRQALAEAGAQAAEAAARIAEGALPEARELAAGGVQPGAAWAEGGLAERLAASEAGAAPGAAGAGASRPPAVAGGTAAGSGAAPGAVGAGGSGTGGTQGGTGAGSRGLVATPRERSGTGGVYVDGGPLGSGAGGGEVSRGGAAPGLDGASQPYEDVYADYAAEAAQSLNRSDLPQQVQDLVRDYFMEIQPQR